MRQKYEQLVLYLSQFAFLTDRDVSIRLKKCMPKPTETFLRTWRVAQPNPFCNSPPLRLTFGPVDEGAEWYF